MFRSEGAALDRRRAFDKGRTALAQTGQVQTRQASKVASCKHFGNSRPCCIDRRGFGGRRRGAASNVRWSRGALSHSLSASALATRTTSPWIARGYGDIFLQLLSRSIITAISHNTHYHISNKGRRLSLIRSRRSNANSFICNGRCAQPSLGSCPCG